MSSTSRLSASSAGSDAGGSAQRCLNRKFCEGPAEAASAAAAAITNNSQFCLRKLGAIKTELDQGDTGSKRSEWVRCVTEYESLFGDGEGKQLRSKGDLFHKPQWLSVVAENGRDLGGHHLPLWLMKKCNKEVVDKEKGV